MFGSRVNAPSLLTKLAYSLCLGLVSGFVLLRFLTPSSAHIGINQYEAALFLDLVEGTADKPYVYRLLLPLLVRVTSGLAPDAIHLFLRERVAGSENLEFLFRVFQWETEAALEYATATLLLWASLIGFGHVAARLVALGCSIRIRAGVLPLLSSALLLGLLPLFKYASYAYDPPQLFLFTMALFLLASSQLRAFSVIFVLCCLNKETALLLIPIFAWFHHKNLPRNRYLSQLTQLIASFVGTKLLLTLWFYSNRGSAVELHLLDHNLRWLLEELNWTHVSVIGLLLGLMLYRFKEKDRFLRIALLSTLPPLLLLTLFLGYIDEWRDYYEAYAVAFALIVDSLQRLKNRFLPTPGGEGAAQQIERSVASAPGG